MNEPTPQKQVLRAAAVVLRMWSGRGWDVSAIYGLQDAFSKLPADEQARLMADANEIIDARIETQSRRRAEFDAWLTEQEQKDQAST